MEPVALKLRHSSDLRYVLQADSTVTGVAAKRFATVLAEVAVLINATGKYVTQYRVTGTHPI